tara:strand:+ start:506 stop:1966 length:1461 start_codon:yes stop_codon:yes gene_type:complete
MKFNFNGRDDGLGNRLEELIKLQNFCQEYGHKVIYRWNNDGKFKYPIIFSCKDINIIEAENRFNKNSFDQTNLWRLYVSQGRGVFNLDNIEFNFPNQNKIQNIDLGVHIRAKDRVISDIDETKSFNGFSTTEELEDIIEKSIKFVIKNYEGGTVFVCSDDLDIKEGFIYSIEKYVNVFQPQYDQSIGLDINDFYTLSNCKKILMGSKYSTFAITASLISGKKLIGFNDEFETDLYRFNTNYINLEANNVTLRKINKNLIPKDLNNYISIGRDFNDTYVLDKLSMKRTDILFSLSASKNIFFEENFILLNNSKFVMKNSKTGLVKFFHQIISVANLKKNRKVTFFEIIKELKRYIFLLKNKSFIFSFDQLSLLKKIFKNYNNVFLKINFDLIDTEILSRTIIYNHEKITGVILEASHLEFVEEYVNLIIDKTDLIISYISFSNKHSNSNEGYIVLTNTLSKNDNLSSLPLSIEVPRNNKNPRVIPTF